MDSIIALIQGMGLFHLQWGQAVMIAISLLLLWLAISRKFEPLLLLPIGFGGLLSNIPEAGLAMTALENLLHLGSPEQIAVIAAKLGVAADPALIKTALATAPGSTVNQLEALSMDMGYSAGILALFYKVAIGYGIAPLVIFMGVGAMSTRCIGIELFRHYRIHAPASGLHRYYRWCRRSNRDLPYQ